MNMCKKCLRYIIGCGSILCLLLGWNRMHAPNMQEVERQVSNVIALFSLNAGPNLRNGRLSVASLPSETSIREPNLVASRSSSLRPN
jgi:hypothetical protein